MEALFKQLEELERQTKIVQKKIDNARGSRTFKCACGKSHRIKDCVGVQTYWYVPPRGCSDGDYHNPGELQIRCPDNPKILNRILFSLFSFGKGVKGLDWKDLDKLEENFKRMYRPLFKAIDDGRKNKSDDEEERYNNYFFARNYKKFELKTW